MAKTQKTVMIPEDLYRMFAEQEKRTGVTFARQALAAFCSYFFTSRTGPDSLWIEAVVAVENGDLSIAEVPAYVARAKADRARKIATRARQLLADDTYSHFSPDAMDKESTSMEAESFAWKRMQERKADPIDAYIASAKHHQTTLGFHLQPDAPADEPED